MGRAGAKAPPACLARRSRVALAVATVAGAFVLLLNVVFLFARGPAVEHGTRATRRHADWFAHAACEDTSESCYQWALRGGCKWDATTQALCKATCGRCPVGSDQTADASAATTSPLLHLRGFEGVIAKMRATTASALVAPELEAARQAITHRNYVRLGTAHVDPHTCQGSREHRRGAVVAHDYGSVFRSGAAATSVQAVCRFGLIPTKNQDVLCEDKRTCPLHERAAQCYGADFAHMVRSCDRTCGFCDTCADADDGARCLERARAGECRSDLAHMAARCAKACGLCLYMYDAAPPHFVALWNGLLMPTIGFGTAGLGARTAGAVAAALRVGYRALDSAEAREWYREDLVAQAVRESTVPREEVFLTTKVHPRNLGRAATRAAVERSLDAFGADHLDLVLLHYPDCFAGLCATEPEGSWRDAWRALEDLVREGRVLAIGVSNFSLEQLVELAEWAELPPAVVQRRSDVLTQDAAVQRLAIALGIQYSGYSSLGTQYPAARRGGASPVLAHPAIQRIAAAHNASEAQVLLRYALGTGQVVVPRSADEKHMNESLHAGAVALGPLDLILLRALDGQAHLVTEMA